MGFGDKLKALAETGESDNAPRDEQAAALDKALNPDTGAASTGQTQDTGHSDTATTTTTPPDGTKKKLAGKYDTPEDLENAYKESERMAQSKAQEAADLRKQDEANRRLIEQLLAARQAPDTGKKEPDDDDELLESMATTLGVPKERIVKLIDSRADRQIAPAKQAAEAARWKAMWAEAKADDKEIGKHSTEVTAYMQAHPAVMQQPNPYLSAWEEMQRPVREQASKEEVKRLIDEAYERGRKEAAGKGTARTAPHGGGIPPAKPGEPSEKELKVKDAFGDAYRSRSVVDSLLRHSQ